jgi:arginyl-tRNA synthetase
VAELTQNAMRRPPRPGLSPPGRWCGAMWISPKVQPRRLRILLCHGRGKTLHMAPGPFAQAILDHLDLEGSYFQRAEIAGPGFLISTWAPAGTARCSPTSSGRARLTASATRGTGRRSWWSSSPPTPPAPCTWATPGAACWGDTWPTCSAGRLPHLEGVQRQRRGQPDPKFAESSTPAICSSWWRGELPPAGKCLPRR